jgi:hypothetical protein
MELRQPNWFKEGVEPEVERVPVQQVLVQQALVQELERRPVDRPRRRRPQ